MRLGTRGSALALAQAGQVAELLGGEQQIELVVIESSGSPANDKARWTRSLDNALLEGEVDFALHSAKDVPAIRPDGIAAVGVPTREIASDSICGCSSLSDLPEGATVGTASPRRAALIGSLREDLRVVELRGNIDTRLRRLSEGDCDAAILATAGLRRIGRESDGNPLDTESFMPAAGQGTLLLEARSEDQRAHEVGGAITDPESVATLAAERAVVIALNADCHTALGVYAQADQSTLSVEAICLAPDGSEWLRDRLVGEISKPDELGRSLATRLLASGAERLLAAGRGER